MALITMSRKELGRLEALVDLDEGRITAAQAARLIGVGERQVFRLLKAYRMHGAEGLVSRRRSEGVQRAAEPPAHREVPARDTTAAVSMHAEPVTRGAITVFLWLVVALLLELELAWWFFERSYAP